MSATADKMTSTGRAWLLVRESGVAEGNSLEIQEARGRGLAQGLGFEVADIVGGSAMQGSKAKWHGKLWQTLDRARGGDLIVVADDSRLIRDQAEGRKFIEAADEKGVSIMTAYGVPLTHATADDFERTETGNVRNEAQSRRTREKVFYNKSSRVESGVMPGRIPTFGYERTGKSCPPVVVEREAEAVRLGFTMKADGASESEIQEAIAALGFKRSKAQIRSMLKSEFYLGRVVFAGAKWNLRNEDGQHDAIIDERLWNRAQAAVKPRGRKPESDRLLARLEVLRCGWTDPDTGEVCNSRMVVGTGGRTGEKVPTYKCTTAEHVGRHTCSIMADYVDEIVVEATEEALGLNVGRSSVDLDAADAEIDRLAKLLAKVRTIAEAADDDEDALARVAQVAAEKREAEARRDDLRAVAGVAVIGGLDFAELPQIQRRELIKTLIESATVSPAANRGGRSANTATVIEDGKPVEIPIVPQSVRDRVTIRLAAIGAAEITRKLDAAAGVADLARKRTRAA